MAEVDGQDVLDKKSLKADILQQLIDLAMDDTPQHECAACRFASGAGQHLYGIAIVETSSSLRSRSAIAWPR
jgi:hypothetical protein